MTQAPKKLTDTLARLENQQEHFSEKTLAKIDTEARIQAQATMEQAITDWQNEMTNDLMKPPTVTAYLAGLDMFVTWLKDNDIMQMQPSDIKRFRNAMNEKYSPKTVNLYLTGVRAFYAYLVTSNRIPSNPAREVKSIPVDTDTFKRRALDEAEVIELFDTCKDTDADVRTKAILTLMVYCGLRRVEVHRLDRDDIEIHSTRLVLHVLGKGRNTKMPVPVPLRHIDAILDWIELREIYATTDALFVSYSDKSKGQRLSLRSISESVTDKLNQVKSLKNNKRITVHSLRHTAGTHAWKGMLKEAERTGIPADPLRLQRFMRHRNFKDTQKYLHLEDDSTPVCDLINFGE